MTRYIQLPNGKQVTLGAYLAAWRKVREMPANQELRGWNHFTASAGEILAEIHKGIHDRINRHDRKWPMGRKSEPGVFWEAWRLSRQINGTRIALHFHACPFYLRKRLAHRITENA